jgi:DNA-binding NarL/FixJ family response regulator
MPIRVRICVPRRFVRDGMAALIDADDRFRVVAGADEWELLVIDDPRGTAGRLLVLDRDREGRGGSGRSARGVAELREVLQAAAATTEPVPILSKRAFDVLTDRELDVLRALAVSGTARMAAARLGASPRTVMRHRQQILVKLDARNVAHAIAIGHARGWLDDRQVTARGQAL